MKPYMLGVHEAGEQMRDGGLSPKELMASTLERIAAVETAINAFVRVFADEALAAAEHAGGEIAAGRYRGPWHGIPIAFKDLYDLAGRQTSASSKVRHDHVATGTATAVSRLTEAGAIVIGKTHTDEFAFGTTTPATRNPWNTGRVPGGSSGGSGAAVASGEVPMAMGSDTGGSVRGPATLCGVVGLKPTYGRISKFGLTPCSWSLDHPGTLTRTVRDAALSLQVLAGFDPRDPATVDVPVPPYDEHLDAGVEGLRVGVPVNYYFDNVDAEVAAGVRAATAMFADLGASLVDVEIPLADLYLPVLFGIIVPEAAHEQERMLRERADLYGEEVRLVYEAGSLMLARDYIRSLRARQVIQQAWREMFDNIDVLVAPTHPAPAAHVGQERFRWPSGREEAVVEAYSRLTGPANIVGLPSMSVPCGLTAGGLPFGMQIVGKPFHEGMVLRVGHAFEEATDWSSALPLTGIPSDEGTATTVPAELGSVGGA